MSLKGSSGTCIVCKARTVADGGVFSPNNGRGGGLVDGRKVGVSFNGSRETEGGLATRSDMCTSSRLSLRLTVDRSPVDDGRSSVRSGDLLSRKLLKSLTFPDWKDCIRRWCAPLIRDLSGDPPEANSVFRVYEEIGVLSRALSTICFAAAAIPAEVFAFVVGLCEPGFNGSGGGARSGSELSHLLKMLGIRFGEVRAMTQLYLRGSRRQQTTVLY